MSDDLEHLSEQLRQPKLVNKKKPLEGTEKHPQGRLFAPTGAYSGDPFKLAPENWMKQPAEGDKAAHADPIAWHSSESSEAPRFDDAGIRQLDEYEHEGLDWNNPQYDEEGNENPDYIDHSVDPKGRPMADYGSAVGMHLGDVAAAMARGGREYVHPLRIPAETVAPPPAGGFTADRPGGSIASGSFRSSNTIVNKETGERTKDTRWTDTAANFATKATDLVEKGKTIEYRNDVEAIGSTSFRTLPETTKTWSEDVLGAVSPRTGEPATRGEHFAAGAFRNEPHPALVHLAERGYNPVQRRSELPGVGEGPPGRRDAFEHGRAWSLQKPTEEDDTS